MYAICFESVQSAEALMRQIAHFRSKLHTPKLNRGTEKQRRGVWYIRKSEPKRLVLHGGSTFVYNDMQYSR